MRTWPARGSPKLRFVRPDAGIGAAPANWRSPGAVEPGSTPTTVQVVQSGNGAEALVGAGVAQTAVERTVSTTPLAPAAPSFPSPGELPPGPPAPALDRKST